MRLSSQHEARIVKGRVRVGPLKHVYAAANCAVGFHCFLRGTEGGPAETPLQLLPDDFRLAAIPLRSIPLLTQQAAC